MLGKIVNLRNFIFISIIFSFSAAGADPVQNDSIKTSKLRSHYGSMWRGINSGSFPEAAKHAIHLLDTIDFGSYKKDIEDLHLTWLVMDPAALLFAHAHHYPDVLDEEQQEKILELAIKFGDQDVSPMLKAITASYWLTGSFSESEQDLKETRRVFANAITFADYRTSSPFVWASMARVYSEAMGEWPQNQTEKVESFLMGYLMASRGNHLDEGWASALVLGQLSKIYLSTGRNKLAAAAGKSLFEVLELAKTESHIFYPFIQLNLAANLTGLGHYNAARQMLDLKFKGSVPRRHEILASALRLQIAFQEEDGKAIIEEVEIQKHFFEEIEGFWIEKVIDNGLEAHSLYGNMLLTGKCDRRFPSGLGQPSAYVFSLMAAEYSICRKKFKKARKAIDKASRLLAQEVSNGFWVNSTARFYSPAPSILHLQEKFLKIAYELEAAGTSLSDETQNNILAFLMATKVSSADFEILFNGNLRNQPLIERELGSKYLTLLRERELFLYKFFENYASNLEVLGKSGKRNDPVDSRTDSNTRYFHSLMLKHRFPQVHDGFISEIQSQLNKDQASIFRLGTGSFRFQCAVLAKDYKCTTIRIKDQLQMAKAGREKFLRKLNENRLNDDEARMLYRELGEEVFGGLVSELPKSITTVFFVPEDDEYSIPLNLAWIAAGHDASLIITPSVHALYAKASGTRRNFFQDYVGIGDPSYHVKEIKVDDFKTNISGISFRSSGRTKELAALSQLPASREEILETSRAFATNRVFLGDEAEETELLNSRWAASRIIHFATHALISNEIDGIDEPALVLSRSDNLAFDGLLTSSDIREQRFGGAGVILSGCRTVSDFGGKSPGFAGLSLAFLASEAKWVLATQWKIPDKQSKEFIVRTAPEISGANEHSKFFSILRGRFLSGEDPISFGAYLFVSYPSAINTKLPEKFYKSKNWNLPGDAVNGFYTKEIGGRRVFLANIGNLTEDSPDWGVSTAKILTRQNGEFVELASWQGAAGFEFGSKRNMLHRIGTDSKRFLVEMSDDFSEVLKKLEYSERFQPNGFSPYVHSNFHFHNGFAFILHSYWNRSSGEIRRAITRVNIETEEVVSQWLPSKMFSFVGGPAVFQNLHLSIEKNGKIRIYLSASSRAGGIFYDGIAQRYASLKEENKTAAVKYSFASNSVELDFILTGVSPLKSINWASGETIILVRLDDGHVGFLEPGSKEIKGHFKFAHPTWHNVSRNVSFDGSFVEEGELFFNLGTGLSYSELAEYEKGLGIENLPSDPIPKQRDIDRILDRSSVNISGIFSIKGEKIEPSFVQRSRRSRLPLFFHSEDNERGFIEHVDFKKLEFVHELEY